MKQIQLTTTPQRCIWPLCLFPQRPGGQNAATATTSHYPASLLRLVLTLTRSKLTTIPQRPLSGTKGHSSSGTKGEVFHNTHLAIRLLHLSSLNAPAATSSPHAPHLLQAQPPECPHRSINLIPHMLSDRSPKQCLLTTTPQKLTLPYARSNDILAASMLLLPSPAPPSAATAATPSTIS